METTIEPVIKDDSTEQRDQLRSMAEEAGPLTGNEFEADASSATKTEPRAPVETDKETVSNPDTKPEVTEKPKVERPRDELGRFTKTEAGEDIPEADRKPAEQPKAEEAKAETAYTKAQKERERQENVLKDFEKKKQEFYADSDRIRAQLQREAAEVQRAREQRTSPDHPSQSQQPKHSSIELWNAANDFDARAEKAFEAGDPELFKESLQLAREARKQAGQVQQLEQQAAQQEQAHRFQTVYAQVMEQTIKAEPELAKGDSELSRDVQSLLEKEAVFSHIPDGFAKAVQVAKWKIGYEKSAGLISGLEDENKKLKAENARLNGNLSLNGSGPSGPVPAKRREDMSMDEMRRELRGVAEEAGSLASA